MSKKGGDIRTFFRAPSQTHPEQERQSPRNTAISDPPSSCSPSPAQPARSSGLRLSSLPSSPQTPQKNAKRILTRNDEIKGSDDDDDDDDDDGDDSDSSVESLSAIFGLSKPSPSYARDSATASTPQAKRIASAGGHKSPLTLQQRLRRGGAQQAAAAPTRHRYDMKALLQHARQNERAEESARRADEELLGMNSDDEQDRKKKGRYDDDSDSSSEARGTGARGGKSSLQEKARAVLQGGGGGEDENEEKLVRAIDRTKSKPTRRFCYFFSPKSSSSALKSSSRAAFPYDATSKGAWRFLADPATRDQAMIHHLPHTLVSRGVQLPDELLLWIMREVCLESNAQLRLRYCDLAVRCGDSVGRLVSTRELYRMLEGLGGPKYPRVGEQFHSILELEDAYDKRDWGPLISFLRMLAQLAPFLSDPTDAILLLLRMSLDPICGNVVRHEHSLALEALVMAIPASDAEQRALGTTICAYTNTYITETVLKVQAINSIPRTNLWLQSLWRNVAQTVLVGDAFTHITATAGEVAGMGLLLKRLDQEDFVINQDTDFEELKALVTLLDSAIGNGSFLRTLSATTTNNELSGQMRNPHPNPNVKPPSPSIPTAHAESSRKEANKRFDATVDALTRRIETLQNKIHDSNSSERKEVKTALDALAKRLAYSVRTRPPPKTSIFDTHSEQQQQRREQEQAELPKQRDFMRSWALASTSATTVTTKNGNMDMESRLNAVLVDGQTGQSHGI